MTKRNCQLTLYTTDQTRSLDQLAIAQTDVSGRQLMQIAGERAFTRIMRRYPKSQNAIVLCGCGNNGGDGYVVAALLQTSGIIVTVIHSGIPKTRDALNAYQSYLDGGGGLATYSTELIANADLIIDGLLGAGLSRAPEGQIAKMIQAANANPCPCIALDLPSGLSGDTGHAFIPANSTEPNIPWSPPAMARFP